MFHPVVVKSATSWRGVLAVALGAVILGGCLAPEEQLTPRPDATATAAASATPPPVGSTIDTARFGYLDNLLARVEAGEWEMGTGVELSLRALIGAAAVRVVLSRPQLASYDLTGLIDASRSFLAEDPTPLREAQIGSSLRFLLFDRDQLRDMELKPGEPLPTPLKITPPPILGPEETHLEEPFFDPASRDYDTDCELFFRRFPLGAGTRTCLVARSAEAAGVAYNVYAPAPSLAPFHWVEMHHEWLDEALAAAIPTYLELGEVPSFDVVLAINLDAPGEAATLLNDDDCVIMIYAQIQHRTEADFKQLVARQLAHCFQAATFPEQAGQSYAERRWRQDGLSAYLSNLVYPGTDLEWEALETLLAVDDSSSVLDWSAGAFVWFQYLGNRLGPEELIHLLKSLPADASREEQVAALAAWPAMDEIFHDFALAYTDGTITDSSGERIATQWAPRDADGAQIRETGRQATVEVPPFSLRRSMVVVPTDRLAHLAAPEEMDGVRTSARSYGAGSWGPLPELFPERCLSDNRLLMVTTAAGSEANQRSLEVTSFDTSCG
jgi:hypothetical protein